VIGYIHLEVDRKDIGLFKSIVIFVFILKNALILINSDRHCFVRWHKLLAISMVDVGTLQTSLAEVNIAIPI
jgi:hypothetical protein